MFANMREMDLRWTWMDWARSGLDGQKDKQAQGKVGKMTFRQKEFCT